MAKPAANKRIDAGIKRGRRKPTRLGIPTSPSRKADLGTWQIPPDLDPDTVLDRYLTESTTSEIAGQLGLSRKALVKWLREVRPKEWREVQLIRAHCRLDDGEDGIDRAEDSQSAISLACARERVKAAQFRLTALDPDYRPQQEVVLTGESIGSMLERISTRMLQERQVNALPGEAVPLELTQPDKPE